MNQIFIQDTPIILGIEKPINIDYSIHFKNLKNHSPEKFLQSVENGVLGSKVAIWGAAEQEILKYFSDHLMQITAGGGLVQNPNFEILFILRKGKWDLPKGKPENNEEIEETAIREVMEETGISGLKILSSLPTTHHIYSLQKNKYALKKCIWFHMQSDEWENITIQTEEQITDARWVSIPIDHSIMSGAYPSIRELVGYFQSYYRGIADRRS